VVPIRFRELAGHPVVEWAGVVTAWWTAFWTVSAAIASRWPLWSFRGTEGLVALAATGIAALLAGRHRRRAVLPAAVSVWLAVVGWAGLPVGAAILGGFWWWIHRSRSSRHLVVGRSRWGGVVGLTESDRLLHCHVLGPTGSGKSLSVLWPWMRQDLACGRSFTLIEPKGDLADLVRRAALGAAGTVVRLDPMRIGCPHWNLFAGDGAAAGEGLALALEQVDPSGHPFYRTVGRVLLVQLTRAMTAAMGPEASLRHLLQALRDPAERRRMARASRLPEVEAYLETDFGQLSATRQRELSLGLAHRLEALWLHPGLRAMLSPPYDFTLDELLHAGPAWLLASFSPAHLGQGARAAGTLLWHLLIQAVYRLDPSPTLRHTLYLDEFHQYVSADVGDVLALVRGYGLSLVLAHQDMAQLTPDLQAAVTANARSRLLLGGTAWIDARHFEQEATPHRFPQLRYLPRGRAVWLGIDHGVPTPPRVVRLPRPVVPT
jgi:type IV secretory pathway TraG/TraD family ATPase VirD4